MTIRSLRCENTENSEHFFCLATCETCPQSPVLVVGLNEKLSYDQTLIRAQQHEQAHGADHVIFILEFDPGELRREAAAGI